MKKKFYWVIIILSWIFILSSCNRTNQNAEFAEWLTKANKPVHVVTVACNGLNDCKVLLIDNCGDTKVFELNGIFLKSNTYL